MRQFILFCIIVQNNLIYNYLHCEIYNKLQQYVERKINNAYTYRNNCINSYFQNYT